MMHTHDDPMEVISIQSNLKLYHFSAFRTLAFKAAGRRSPRQLVVEKGREREKGADTGPKLSQSKTLNPSWAHELNLGWLLPASARRHTTLSKTVFSEEKPERDP